MTEELPQRDRRFLTEKKNQQRKKLHDDEISSCKKNKLRDPSKKKKHAWKKELNMLD